MPKGVYIRKEYPKKCFRCGIDYIGRHVKGQFCIVCRREVKKENDRNRLRKFRKTLFYKQYRREKEKKIRATPKGRLDNIMGKSIRETLGKKKNGYSWEKLVGYTCEDLMKHLEKQFDNKMNWNNYGSYWVIDHKIPKKFFKFSSFKDKAFKKCWDLKNLQPMEKFENMRKGSKLRDNKIKNW